MVSLNLFSFLEWGFVEIIGMDFPDFNNILKMQKIKIMEGNFIKIFSKNQDNSGKSTENCKTFLKKIKKRLRKN